MNFATIIWEGCHTSTITLQYYFGNPAAMCPSGGLRSLEFPRVTPPANRSDRHTNREGKGCIRWATRYRAKLEHPAATYAVTNAARCAPEGSANFVDASKQRLARSLDGAHTVRCELYGSSKGAVHSSTLNNNNLRLRLAAKIAANKPPRPPPDISTRNGASSVIASGASSTSPLNQLGVAATSPTDDLWARVCFRVTLGRA